MFELLPADERGETRTEWLHSRHTFTFAEYLNHKHFGYSVLQVINEDRINPGKNTGIQVHENIEILSYVIRGVLVHTDTLGNEQRVTAGEFQLMSAGVGIKHTESNGCADEELHFLQFWILPNQVNLRPGYQQRRLPADSNFALLASPSPRDNAMFLNQDAEVYRYYLDMDHYFHLGGAGLATGTGDPHQAYVHVVEGGLDLSDGSDTLSINQGDGVICSGIERLELIKTSDRIAEALLFVLPGDY